jgi:glycerol-3-phosphate dehydrogenase
MAGKSVLRAGFGVYDLVTADRNRGIVDPDRRIPPARFLTRDDVISSFPGVESADLTGGALFHDGQMYSPSRLVLAFARSAADAGAAVANYCEVLTPVLETDRVTGATVRDLESGDTFRIRADQVLNAAGPWAFDWLTSGVGLEFERQRPTFSRDVGLVTRKRLPEPLGLACRTSTRDAETLVDRGARHLFLLPWRGYTTVGVWHGVYRGATDRVEVTPAEIEQFVAETNDAYEGFDLTPDDISMVNTGLILFGEEDQEASSHRFGHRSLVIDHERAHGIKGLTTLIGVRATTARGMAETVVDGMAARFSRTMSGSRTETSAPRGAVRAIRDSRRRNSHRAE